MMSCPQCGGEDYEDRDIANPFDAPRLDPPGPHFIVQVCLACGNCTDTAPASPVHA